MLYYFEIRYFEWTHQQEVTVTIIMDLPQNNISDVRLNPFVIDIVNHPFMKAGILNTKFHNTNLVDNIQPYNITITKKTTEIVCRYQDAPGISNYRSFSFVIYTKLPFGCYFPYSQIEFTCRNFFDYYERLYQSGRFVPAPQIPNSQVNLSINYCYLNRYAGIIEMLKIVNTSNQNRIESVSVSANGQVSALTILNGYSAQICPFRLCDWVLNLIGFIPKRGNIYGLNDVDYFEGIIKSGNNAVVQLCVKKEKIGYSVWVPDATQTSQCRQIICFYLHEMQHIVWNELHVNMRLDNHLLAAICQRYNSIEKNSEIMATIPAVVASYIQNNPGSLNTNSVINHVANYFGITVNEAQSILVIMHL